MRRQAFTLLELMVVIAIVALVSAITLGALSSVSKGNKRTTCQTNLAQIYSAARQYSRDYDGQLPYRNFQPPAARTSSALPAGGLGLWALYTYPAFPGDTLADAYCDNSLTDVPAPHHANPAENPPLTGYLKSTKFFHCPLDDFKHDVSYNSGGSCSTFSVSSSEYDFDPGDGIRRVNPYFLSYQAHDNSGVGIDGETYSSVRNPGEKRQLEYYIVSTGPTPAITTPNRRTPDETVITWCYFHRALDNTGNTVGPGTGGDNVLFADGSIQSIPMKQAVKDQSNNTGVCDSWRRVPLASQNSLVSASACTVNP